jgi:transglutaminase-like putative cysteine protease
MKKLLLLIYLISQAAWAQVEYQAGILSADLKENAHAVVRRHETIFTVKSAGEGTLRIRSVVTVLDEQGDDHAKKQVWYDKLSKVTNFEGALYDAAGKLIKKLKKADIEDYSSYSDYNLFDDNRFKAATFPKQPTYPYTVEFIIETTERNLMSYPTWIPQNEQHLSVEQATFTVNMPAGLALRYKGMNISTPVAEEVAANGGKTYVWQLANIPAVEFEPLSPPAREQLPIVYTAPTDFEVQDYKGKITSWSDVGRFYHNLNDGRDRLPDDLRQRVIDLTKNETTTSGKVKKVYHFLQEQTRYVSVQLGIGGWQTIEAEKVAVSKYGDCKALTNYTKALLKAAGVTAHPALVRAGDDEPDALTDFPSFQFNHIILCVPDGRDTLFLECTDGHNPAGYVSDFTGSRHVLLILPEGSRLVKTPAYRPIDNLQQRRITIKVTEQGDATADVRTRYTGLQQDVYASALHRLNRDDQRSWLLKRIHIPAFELNTFAYKELPGSIPAVTENLDLTVRRWATTSGTRLFLPLNLMSALSQATPLTQPRKAPVDFGSGYDYEDSDTITYQLPKGYSPEYQIEPMTIESKFGRYSAQLAVEGGQITYIRKIAMHRGRFPATAYAEWVDFRKKVAKADRAQMVLVKN